MPVDFRAPFRFLLLPLCVILAAVATSSFYLHAGQTTDAETVATTSSIIDQSSEYEDWLQEKAERVLTAFGESSPVAVITVEMKMDKSETEVFSPNPELRAVESVQQTEELMERKEDTGVMLTTVDKTEAIDGFRPKYRNNKQAKNYLVGQTKTKTVRLHPKLGKVTVAVFVSDHNQDRRKEIETAVAVALGLDFDRGDAVLASVH